MITIAVARFDAVEELDFAGPWEVLSVWARTFAYPRGHGVTGRLGDERIRARLRRLAERGTLMTSVCTGALVYADAGLLDVRPESPFVDSGEIITAAGVSAGSDMALHLVARLRSEERAREVRRHIRYDPEPPV